MQLNCGFFGFLLFFCRLKILCVWICCVVSRIKSHLYICALHISIVAVSPLSCDAAEDTLLCCPHNKVEKEKLGYFTLKTLCMESTHNGVVFSWDSLRSLSSLSFEFSLFFLESFFFLTPVMFFFLCLLMSRHIFRVVHPCFHLSVLLSYSCKHCISEKPRGWIVSNLDSVKNLWWCICSHMAIWMKCSVFI